MFDWGCERSLLFFGGSSMSNVMFSWTIDLHWLCLIFELHMRSLYFCVLSEVPGIFWDVPGLSILPCWCFNIFQIYSMLLREVQWNHRIVLYIHISTSHLIAPNQGPLNGAVDSANWISPGVGQGKYVKICKMLTYAYILYVFAYVCCLSITCCGGGRRPPPLRVMERQQT